MTKPHVPLLPNPPKPLLTWPLPHRYVSSPHTFTHRLDTCHSLPRHFPLSLLMPISTTLSLISFMAAIRASISIPAPESDRMVKIELEAAEALAELAHFPANTPESHGSESVAERVKDESNDGNSWFDSFTKCSNNSSEDLTNFTPKKRVKSRILMEKSLKDEKSLELRLNPTYPANCASSSGRKSRQNLTEAEMEARKIRRVLANRESARQTIRRRQAVYEELNRKAVDLAWENENLKREKETASNQYDTLKNTNECLKAQMIKMVKVEAEETREESNATNEPTVSASSTNSPFIIYNQPPFLPLVWPSVIQPTNSVQLQCGSPAGIVFPSRSSFEEGNSTGTGTPLYLLPCPWLFTLPQTTPDPHPHPRPFNLNDKPKESSSECQQFSPEKVEAGFPPDGGGHEQLIEHDDNNNSNNNNNNNNNNNSFVVMEDVKGVGGEVSVTCSGGNRLGDVAAAAAAEARKRRKQLTRLKNHLHCRQLRMH